MTVGGLNPNAWNNWYHCVGSTYGSWLRGDPRGFRTFHHREHVEGDYRRPPEPGIWEAVFEASEASLRYPPVVLELPQRCCVCQAFIDKLQRDAVEPVALAIASNHFHLLARFPALTPADLARLKKTILRDGRDPAPRHFLGRARRHASFALSEVKLKPASPVWATRPKCEPIRDRSHQVNTTRYIADHVKQNAATWVVGRGFSFPV
ncbi:MAG: hypothetical protein ACIAXF_00275 [Phycisphaerales bacterium JB063]